MNKRVLIIDDDKEFSELLMGIFEQADYKVFGAPDAEEGMAILGHEEVDLIVLDQRLPGGISGTDLIARLKEQNVDLPIIMVSGFLDDDSIRDLIRDGVAGVFMKPLNIFSLLKKASETIVQRKVAQARVEKTSGSEAGESTVKRRIGNIEGLSKVGEAFVQKAQEAAGFRRNLLLIGPRGTLFEEIARDLIQISGHSKRTIALKPGQISKEKLGSFFDEEETSEGLALIILEAESLTHEEILAIMGLAEEKGGVQGLLRLVFCLSQSVEDLYDSGTIDEEFYLFLGSNELKVPPLKQMPEDLVAIARKEILEHCKEGRVETKLRTFLLSHEWPENMLELRSVIVRAISLAKPMPPQVKHFEAALSPEGGTASTEKNMRSSLERFLHQEKHRFLAAVELLQKS